MTTRINNWRPILSNGLKRRAQQAIGEIVDQLSALGLKSSDVSLSGGKAGIALLFGYLSLSGHTSHKKLATQFLQTATNVLEEAHMRPDLYSGFAGIAWACSHLEKELGVRIVDFAEVDLALEKYLSKTPWRADYDLISGLVGYGVYALERLDQPAARRCLKNVIDRLDETAEKRGDEITWFTAPHLLPEWQRKEHPKGYYNLGLAHGVPGVIVLLAHADSAGVQRRKSKKLLRGAVNWLLRRKSLARVGSCFSSRIGPDLKETPTRCAWCYGDPGVASALFLAARLCREKDWEKEALEIALHASEQKGDESGVKDAGICHGAAGLAHIFNRFFQATNKVEFKNAAQYWFERTLQYKRPDTGIAGYLAYEPKLNGQVAWKKEAGVLTGAAGIALVLLAACSNVEPQWDRMLLIS